jgi:polyhydroxyalkanoate synthesis regulator protein
MFEQAMRMFLPFGGGRPEQTPRPKEPGPAPQPSDSDFDALRRQLDEMQKKIDKLSSSE